MPYTWLNEDGWYSIFSQSHKDELLARLVHKYVIIINISFW
jgi:hypothetical protein